MTSRALIQQITQTHTYTYTRTVREGSEAPPVPLKATRDLAIWELLSIIYQYEKWIR